MAVGQIQVRQENPIWDPVISDAAKFGALYLLYSSVTACFVSKLSDALKLQVAAIAATASTVIAGVGERWAEQEEYEELKTLCHRVVIVVFCAMDLMMRDLLTHELGHAIAAQQCFFDAFPRYHPLYEIWANRFGKDAGERESLSFDCRCRTSGIFCNKSFDDCTRSL